MSQPLEAVTESNHGTSRCYDRGCRLPECKKAYHRHRKYLAHRAAQGDPARGRLIDATPAREHLAALRAADPSITDMCIARVAGIAPQSLKQLADGLYPTITTNKADAILAVTVDQARAERGIIPAGEIIPLVRQLQAAGYPVKWMVRQGVKCSSLVAADALHNGVKPPLAQAVRDLHKRYADIPATPENTGCGWQAIRSAQTFARKAGYRPAWYCDTDGNIDPRSIPAHPWSQLDEDAAQRLDVLRDTIAGHSLDETAQRRGIQARQVSRRLEAAGLRVTEPDTVARVKALLDEYDYGDGDPVNIALRIGVLVDSHLLCADHPSIVAWREQQAAERANSAYAA